MTARQRRIFLFVAFLRFMAVWGAFFTLFLG